MKMVPLSRAKAKLSHYGRMCRKEPVVVTVNGVPSFKLVAVEDGDDLVDQLVEHSTEFGQLLKRRLREPNISTRAAAQALRSRG